VRTDRSDAPSPDEVLEEIGAPSSIQVAAPPDGRLLLAGDGLEAVEDALARRTRVSARTVRTEVTVRSGDAILARADLRSLDGRPSAVRAGTDETFIADYDVEVGCYIQIADPIVDTLFAGWLVRVRPKIAPDGRSVRLEVLLVDQTRDALAVRGTDEPVSGIIHHPTVRAREDRLELVVRPGEITRTPLGRGPRGEPREVEIRATLQ
jgi:hypothetical protein